MMADDAATREPCPDGFRWIGQPLSSCDKCGQPAWEHAGLARYPLTSPFDDTPAVLQPWAPGQAERIARSHGAVLGEAARLRQELAEAKADVGRAATMHNELAQRLLAVEAERDEARAEVRAARTDIVEQMQVAIALYGQGVDPNGYYAGTPGARARELLAAEAERDRLREELERFRSLVEGAVAAAYAAGRAADLNERKADG